MASNAEKAAELLAPILARPETPQEHVRHGIMLLQEAQREGENAYMKSDFLALAHAMTLMSAASDRLWKAVEQLERP